MERIERKIYDFVAKRLEEAKARRFRQRATSRESSELSAKIEAYEEVLNFVSKEPKVIGTATLDRALERFLVDNCTEVKEKLKKLGELEGIEGELGIDLVTVFKALKTNKIFIKADYDGENIMPCNCFSLNLNGSANYYFYCQYGLVNEEYDFYNLKDYGKTWALTKEELEK